MFHKQCIDTWLETSYSCPECRYQLKCESPVPKCNLIYGQRRYITLSYVTFSHSKMPSLKMPSIKPVNHPSEFETKFNEENKQRNKALHADRKAQRVAQRRINRVNKRH